MNTITRVKVGKVTFSDATKIKVERVKKTDEVLLITQEYISLNEKIAQLEERLTEVKSIIKLGMTNNQLVTPVGTFKIETRRKYSWMIDSVKDIFKDQWTMFVKPDDALLRQKMETKDFAGCSLEASAKVTITEAFTFRK